jgi:hypothetical protein
MKYPDPQKRQRDQQEMAQHEHHVGRGQAGAHPEAAGLCLMRPTVVARRPVDTDRTAARKPIVHGGG